MDRTAQISSGFSGADLGNIVNAVRHITGVKKVVNRIKIVPRVPAERVQTEIRKLFVDHAREDAEHIHVDTMGDRVLLSGTVRSLQEREDAEIAAQNTLGVFDVENRIRIATSGHPSLS